MDNGSKPSGDLGNRPGQPRGFFIDEDCCAAIVLAAQRYDKPEPVNIGAGREIMIRDLVELITRLTGFRGETIWDPSKPDGQPRRCLDTSRALCEFGFRAGTDFEQGLKKTIEWYADARRSGLAA